MLVPGGPHASTAEPIVADDRDPATVCVRRSALSAIQPSGICATSAPRAADMATCEIIASFESNSVAINRHEREENGFQRAKGQACEQWPRVQSGHWRSDCTDGGFVFLRRHRLGSVAAEAPAG